MEAIDMRIVYVFDAVVFIILLGRSIYYYIKRQYHKTELSITFMLIWMIVIMITIFTHAVFILNTDNY